MHFFKVNKNNLFSYLNIQNPESFLFSVQVPLSFCWLPKNWKGISTEKVYRGKKKKKILTLHKVFQGHGMKTFSPQQKQK